MESRDEGPAGAATGGPPAPASPGPVAEPPRRKRFAGPFFFWLLAFALPVGVAALTLSTYVHEFSHGLAALATGGHFLGIKGTVLNQRSSIMAYADAWSDDYDGLVIAAGILVNVLIGLLLLGLAFRTRSPLRRLIAFLFAGAFLADLDYAVAGSLLWDTSDFDSAVLLSDADSPPLRWVCFILLFAATGMKALILGRGLFRTWEDVFGGLSADQAFWVILFLVGPVPLPATREESSGWVVLSAAVLLVAIAAILIRTRRRSVATAPAGKFSRWGWGVWAAGLVSLVAMGILERGLRFGTYTDRLVFDLSEKERTIAGLAADFGMAERHGAERPAFAPKLFVAGPDEQWIVASPSDRVIDLAWQASRQRILLVTPEALFAVDPRSGECKSLWGAGRATIKVARHGPNGEILAVAEEVTFQGRGARYSFRSHTSLYVHDPREDRGAVHPLDGAAGNPFFLPGFPTAALVSVDDDLWKFTWPEEAGGDIEVDRQTGASAEGWLEGVSSGAQWWSGADGWRSGDVRVPGRQVENWGVGAEGFFALKRTGGWELITPAGVRRKGPLHVRSVSLLHFSDGVPWVVFRNGEVRPLTAERVAFRARMPP